MASEQNNNLEIHYLQEKIREIEMEIDQTTLGNWNGK
jgi:hypothetical protein